MWSEWQRWLDQLHQVFADFAAPLSTAHPLVVLPLNCLGFWIGLKVYRRVGSPLLHPVAGGSLLIFAALVLLGVDFTGYQRGSGLLYLLLGPAVVALAIPLRQNLAVIREVGWPLMLGLLVGAVLAPLVAVVIALLLGASQTVLIALSTKSVTAPVALALAQEIDGIQSLAAGVVAFTGIIGAVLGPSLLRRLNLTDERVVGFTLGINAHAIGTVRALEISALCGAFSALAMGLCGALTALVLPLLVT
ncbi:LrgB family protein [Microbulbifer hydrolyticus]|uniref:Effector of murein hydrolase n=1 Tax=Microbulbifer hydrolyticus TaxID=48074 RepID=A0A6P1TAG8_9GAMM|nr:LrgB family protein [Microbulbifer hydrolyticus]MBB5211633.1 putative effector of murein hydrolase [Microbulbifer hydrolyticus]QHQ37632.1 LrgB family protein [Microbulbifer hydrolyticus]